MLQKEIRKVGKDEFSSVHVEITIKREMLTGQGKDEWATEEKPTN